MRGKRKTRWKRLPLEDFIGDTSGGEKDRRSRDGASDQSVSSDQCGDQQGCHVTADVIRGPVEDNPSPPEGTSQSFRYHRSSQPSDADPTEGSYINGLWIPHSEMLKYAPYQPTVFSQYPVPHFPVVFRPPHPRQRQLDLPLYPLDLPLFPNYFIPSSSHYFFYLTRHRQIPTQRPYKRNFQHHPRCPYWHAMNAPYDVMPAGPDTSATEVAPLDRPTQDQMAMGTLAAYVYPGYTFGPPGFVSHVPTAPPFRPQVHQQPTPQLKQPVSAVVETPRQRKRKKKRRALLEDEDDSPESLLSSSVSNGTGASDFRILGGRPSYALLDRSSSNQAVEFGSNTCSCESSVVSTRSSPTESFIDGEGDTTTSSQESTLEIRRQGTVERFAEDLVDRLTTEVQNEVSQMMNGYDHLVEEEERGKLSFNGFTCQSVEGQLQNGPSEWPVCISRHNSVENGGCPAVHQSKRDNFGRGDEERLKEVQTENVTVYDSLNNNSPQHLVGGSVKSGQHHTVGNRIANGGESLVNGSCPEERKSKSPEKVVENGDCFDFTAPNDGVKEPVVVSSCGENGDVHACTKDSDGEKQSTHTAEVHVFGRRCSLGRSEEEQRTSQTPVPCLPSSSEMVSPLEWKKHVSLGMPHPDTDDRVVGQGDRKVSVSSREEDDLISEITRELGDSVAPWTKAEEDTAQDDNHSMRCFDRSLESLRRASAPNMDILVAKGQRRKSSTFSVPEEVGAARSSSSTNSVQVLDRHCDGSRASEEPSSFTYLSYLASSEALLRETEIELSKLTARRSLQANQSIYKLAYDEAVTDPSDTEEEAKVAPPVQEKEKPPPPPPPAEQPPAKMAGGGGRAPLARNFSEIVVHEADDVSDAGSEDVELLPHRYETDSAGKHLYFNRLSLAAELLRTKEQLPYDSEFKRVVVLLDDEQGAQGPVCISEQPASIGADNPAFVGDSLPRKGGGDSGIQSEVSEHEVAEEAKEECGKVPGLEDEDEDSWIAQPQASGYRWFGAQTRQKLSFMPPRGGPVPPCFCCVIM